VTTDFGRLGDQEDLFGLVAWVPTMWCTLDEISGGGQWPLSKITAAVNAARRRAWITAVARHGALPGIRGRGQDTRRGDLHPATRQRGERFGLHPVRREARGIEGGGKPSHRIVAAARWKLSAT
jgi:hypothetical protein